MTTPQLFSLVAQICGYITTVDRVEIEHWQQHGYAHKHTLRNNYTRRKSWRVDGVGEHVCFTCLKSRSIEHGNQGTHSIVENLLKQKIQLLLAWKDVVGGG